MRIGATVGRVVPALLITVNASLPARRAQAFRFISALSLFKSAVSIGGCDSLVCHPASTTHSGVPAELREAAGVSEGLIRISIGLEHIDDLIADLRNAFRQCVEDFGD